MILPVHSALDKAREESRHRPTIGTTGRGIGPAYESQVARTGIRVCDLLEPDSLRERIEIALYERNFLLEHLYRWPKIDADDLFDEGGGLGREARPVRRRHRRRARPRRPRRPLGPVRGRAGDTARRRPRDLPVRDLVHHHRRRRLHRRGHRPDPDRLGASASARRTRPASAAARSRPRTTATPASTWAGSGSEFGATTGRNAPLRLARPRGHALRGSRERASPASRSASSTSSPAFPK